MGIRLIYLLSLPDGDELAGLGTWCIDAVVETCGLTGRDVSDFGEGDGTGGPGREEFDDQQQQEEEEIGLW